MSTSLQRFDIAVIGGGPAGAFCAFLLARAGAKVALLDGRNHSADSVELLSGNARRRLEGWLDYSLLSQIRSCEVFQTTSLWNTLEPVITSSIFNPWGAALGIIRSEFDGGLRQMASQVGATVLPNTKVTILHPTPSGWRLVINNDKGASMLYSSLLVIATGRASRTLLGRNPIVAAPQLALLAPLASRSIKLDHDFYLEATQHGWWYSIPDPRGGLFAGYCTEQIDEIRHRGKPLRSWWIEELLQTRLFINLLRENSLIGPVIGRSASMRSFDTVSGTNWIAVGDAAFTPDPLSGKGLEFGIESAIFGTRLLLSGERRSAMQEYEDWIREYARQHEQIRDIYSNKTSKIENL